MLKLLDVPRQKAALLRPVTVGGSSELLVGQRVGAGRWPAKAGAWTAQMRLGLGRWVRH